MTRVLSFLFVLFWPHFLVAQTVTVRSGEHGDFTRLVLTIPDINGWSLVSDSETSLVALTFTDGPLDFDTSAVFNRINKNRVAGFSVSENGKQLTVSLACACGAEAFVLGDSMLVVDILPQKEAISMGASALSDKKEVGLSPLFSDFSEVRLGSKAGIGPIRETDSSLSLLPHGIYTKSEADAEVADGSDGPLSPQDVGDRLAANLAVVATQGLLDPAFLRPTDNPPQRIAAPDLVNPAVPIMTSADLARQLATGLSGLDHRNLQSGQISVGGENCVPDSDLAIHSWAKADADPSEILAARRGEVFGEFDRISPAALKTYAQTLIYYGFGAEARMVMSLHSESTNAVLISLSYLVDAEEDPEKAFEWQSNCEGLASLWSVLSDVSGPKPLAVNEAALLRAFESLPKHLRSHLGSNLASNLSRAGHERNAAEVLRRLERMEGQQTDSIALGKAMLALKDGDHDEAGHLLRDLSVEGGPEAAAAVAAAIDLADASDTLVPARIVELSQAFAVELRNSEDGEKLWQAHVRSLLVNRAFDDAFAQFTVSHGMPQDVLNSMQQTAMVALVQDAPDVTFLKIATRALSDGMLPESESLALTVSQRFLLLGLPELALDQLNAIPDWENFPKARLTRAEALLTLGRPEDAEIILIGQRGDAVSRLRAEARRQMGDHVFARSLFEDAGDRDAALSAAWLSGDWTSVAASESALSGAAKLMQGKEDASLAPDQVSLGAVEVLSFTSAASRETLRALLEVTKIPDDE